MVPAVRRLREHVSIGLVKRAGHGEGAGAEEAGEGAEGEMTNVQCPRTNGWRSGAVIGGAERWLGWFEREAGQELGGAEEF